MENQPTINIGMIGSVSNGKSSLVEVLTKAKTQRYSSEKKTNKTIHLGYANAKIFKCSSCEPPECYQSFPSSVKSVSCDVCNKSLKLVRHISFVDCPGHNMLMATMLNGTCVMDSTVLVESLNSKTVPAQQTVEHLKVAKIVGLHNKIVCVNKLDLVKKDVAKNRISQLKEYLDTEDTVAKDSLIVPTVGNYGFNKDVLCEYLCTEVPEPVRDLESPIEMIAIRSFNVNRTEKVADLVGGVIGGSIMKGVLKIGDDIMILPGIVTYKDDIWSYIPLRSKVVSISTERTKLAQAIPGGLIGVQLDIDPGLTEKNRLVGSVLTAPETEYKVYHTLYIIFESVLESIKLKKGDKLVVNYNASNIKCTVARVKKNKLQLNLDKPICVISIKDKIYATLSRLDLSLLGRGEIADGEECTIGHI